MPCVKFAVLAYLAGVLVGVWRVDGSPLMRVAVAAAWPLGVAAAVVTANLLWLSAAVLFPWFGMGMLAAAVAVWWMVP
jgi:hypothetical protein